LSRRTHPRFKEFKLVSFFLSNRGKVLSIVGFGAEDGTSHRILFPLVGEHLRKLNSSFVIYQWRIAVIDGDGKRKETGNPSHLVTGTPVSSSF
jgi:hypothetical protein